ncbi:MAG: flippase activity-associated protein Agl23 [Acidobacteriota bacterium]
MPTEGHSNTGISRFWDRPVPYLVGVNRESLAWGFLIVLAAATRFFELGLRAMSHDEGQHAFYSYNLYATGAYTHNPVTHGPFLFHLNALIYFLFGASDSTARLAPALAGIGVVILVWSFRRGLGRSGALAAGLLVALSPTLLFHSRYLRNDITMALWVLIWTAAAFRYRKTRNTRWLSAMTVAMALAFVTKENSFIFGATIGIFFSVSALWTARIGEGWKWRGPEADLSILMMTLILPFLSPLAYLMLGWDINRYADTENLWRNLMVIATAIAASAAIGFLWFGFGRSGDNAGGRPIGFGLWSRLFVLFWTIQALLFTTFLTNFPRGLVTGIVGSLGYWLTQHPVARGSQPAYYYLVLASVYELLPLIVSLAAMIALAMKLRHPMPTTSSHLVPRSFIIFLAWWTAASWIGYSIAGEKMPWLVLHIVLPSCLLGGWWLGNFLERIDWHRAARQKALWLTAVAPLLLVIGWRLIGRLPFQGRDLIATAATAQWFFYLLLGILLIAGCRRWIQRAGRRLSSRLILAGFLGLLFLWMVRCSLMLNFRNYDLATELMVYAHGTPDIKRAMGEIELISRRTAGDRQLAVAFDDDSAWPFSWYLRNYPNRKFYAAAPTLEAMKSPVVIVGPKNVEKVRPFMARDYIKRVYRLIWWPVQDYKDITWGRLAKFFSSAESRDGLWQFLMVREYPGVNRAKWPFRHEFEMYVRRDIASQIWDLGVVPLPSDRPERELTEFHLTVVDTYAGVFTGKPLLRPRDVTVSPEGTRIVADTGNDRILLLDKEGNFLRAFGSRCALTETDAPGCIDPDGGGPLELGDGQFREPWGVAAGGEGLIFVADTWNGRIEVFDSQGQFLRKWGSFGSTGGKLEAPVSLFGPRSLVWDGYGEGELLVADTGNKRILRFSPEGEFLTQFGGGGIQPGEFDEPVGLASNPADGSLYVADAWNQRIQKFDSKLKFLSEWPVAGWRDRGIFSKPYLAVDSQGRLFATDSERSRVLMIDREGNLSGVSAAVLSDGTTLQNPNGLAVDSEGDRLLVADAHHDRILLLALPD